jgi:CubicO group peptidase (beta-lactamase class C family)
LAVEQNSAAKRAAQEQGMKNVTRFGAYCAAVLAVTTLAACGRVGGRSIDGIAPQSPPPTNPPPSAPTNSAPVANAGPDLTIELPTDSVALSGSATDDSLPTSTLNFLWEYVSGPLGPNSSPGAVIACDSSPATSVRFPGGVGEYTFNLRASDGALSGVDVVRVTVSPTTSTCPATTFAGWPTATPAEENMDPARLDEARNYSRTASLGKLESGLIVRHGRVVYQWGSATRLYEMKSTTKSIGGLAFLMALDSNTLALTDRAIDRLPVFGTEPPVDASSVSSGSLNEITLLQLATHTAGMSKPDDVRREPRRLLDTPGTTWRYSDQALNWLADTLTQTYAQDLNTYLGEKVFSFLGIQAADLNWRTNDFRTPTLSVNGAPVARREFASGINANVDAMARVGYLMLRKGVWCNTMILSNAIVEKSHTPQPEIASATIVNPVDFPNATSVYGLLWWTNADGVLPDVPRDAFWAWGLHESFIIVVPSLDLVIVRAGSRGWHPLEEENFWNGDYTILEPFLTPIVQSVTP